MRKCTICNAIMHEGYLNENDDSTYCGAGCLSAHMTLYEFGRAYKAGTCFWTSWMDDDEEIIIGKTLLKYECDECGEVIESIDPNLIYCSSNKCESLDNRLTRLHEL